MTTFICLTNKKPGVFFILGLFFTFITILSTEVSAQDPFITTWKTDNSGASDPDQITIPTFPGETYNYDVYWEDTTDATDNGTINGNMGDLTITFPDGAGIYRVEITGDFPRIYFWNDGDPSDTEKILTIEQWGDITWNSMEFAFRNASNLELNTTTPDAPDLSGVTSTRQMFFGASSMNSDLNHWDVSNVTSMRSMFQQASSFNQPLDNWDVSNVTNMSQMFAEASVFNQDISSWNVSNVTDINGIFAASAFNQNISAWNVTNVMWMSSMFAASPFNQDISSWDVSNVVDMYGMFQQASSFNQDISGWDVLNVTDMEFMFRETSSFNQDISGWDVANVTNMRGMFYDAGAFNHDISGWDVSNVTDMEFLFFNASPFNQDIGSWDIGSVTIMDSMLSGSGLSTTNYDNTLTGWSGQTVQSGITLGANGLEYCAETARQTLTDPPNNWTITGDTLASGCSSTGFIATWEVTAGDLDITIPTHPSQIYNYDVDWGDTTSDTNVTGDATHTYSSAGTYTVEITGDFPQINFHNGGSPSDAEKILTVEQWGDIAWSSMGGAFFGAANLEINAPDAPDLSGVSSMWCMFCSAASVNSDLNTWDVSNVDYMASMFAGASAFNGDISTWDVSNVTDVGGVFGEASAFNGDISVWDVSNATNMSSMFNGATSFDQDISGWDVSSVTDMGFMFVNAAVFNQDIGSWDVSNVTSMASMFRDASAFNQDIGGWNVSNVTDMSFMLFGASAFNQNISAWDVSNVTDMEVMFFAASAFNQDISGWNVGNVTTMANMLNGSGLSTENYDNTLTGWAGQTVQSGVTLGANGLEYCNSETERQSLIDDDGWTITGDVPAASCEPSVQLTGVAGFRMLSSPVEVSLADLLDPIWTQGASGGADYAGGDPNVWTWDNTAAGEDPAGWIPVTDLSATATAGTGVLVYVFDEDEYGVPASAGFPKSLSVSGTVNSLPQTPTINANPEGFTLLGNPVNTGIAWDDITRSELDDVVYVWDPNKGSAGDWVLWSGGAGDLTGGVIHPFQGFFVQTSVGASSPSMTFPTTATTSPEDFFGKEAAEEPLVVRLHLEGEDSLESTAWLRFSEKGSLTRNSTDAVKLQPLAADYAALALDPLSEDESSLLALKHLPLEMTAPLEIPLTATATRGGSFTLETTDMTLPDGWSLSLHDTRTGEKVSVEKGMEYRFELEANERLQKTSEAEDGIPLMPRPLAQPSDRSKRSDGSEARFLLTITPAEVIEADLPDQIALEQNYPNPFNPTTQISYQLPQQSQVRLEVYDMVGRQVATLVDGQVSAGVHQVNFDASRLSSGIYLYRLQTADAVFTKKLTLIK